MSWLASIFHDGRMDHEEKIGSLVMRTDDADDEFQRSGDGFGG